MTKCNKCGRAGVHGIHFAHDFIAYTNTRWSTFLVGKVCYGQVEKV